MLNPKFDAFIQESPISVMARSLVERSFQPEQLDHWFNITAQKQYTKELLFSNVFELMSLVVQGSYRSVNAAYQASPEKYGVSIRAVYDKLNGIEPELSAELVRYAVQQGTTVIKGMGGTRPPLLNGFRTKMLDGNCIEATEHRIKELRDIAAGALPGKSLVVYDPELGIPIDVFPCEDGHTQERALLPKVLLTIEKGDLWIADRNFCVRSFIFGIHQKEAYSIIRQHANLPYEPIGKLVYKGRTETGKVYEQAVRVIDENKQELILRRICVVLDVPTRNKEKEIFILTDLPGKAANAKTVAKLYLKRWTIETAFQYLKAYFKSEINTLGYPPAALFGFCVGLIAYINVFTIISVLSSVHGHEKVEKEVSGYYIAAELSRNYGGMMIAIPPEEWSIFGEMTEAEFLSVLKVLVENVKLPLYKKHHRGPKKPKDKPKADPKKPHVSIAKLLAERKTK